MGADSHGEGNKAYRIYNINNRVRFIMEIISMFVKKITIMKRIRFILMTALVLIITGTYAQTGKSAEIKIKADFHCANGQATIEKGLVKEEGVISAIADLETKVVTIKYDAKKQNKEKLVAAIEKLGYSTEFTKDDTKIKKACSHDQPKKE